MDWDTLLAMGFQPGPTGMGTAFESPDTAMAPSPFGRPNPAAVYPPGLEPPAPPTGVAPSPLPLPVTPPPGTPGPGLLGGPPPVPPMAVPAPPAPGPMPPMTGAGVPYTGPGMGASPTLGSILGGGAAYGPPGQSAGIAGGNAAQAPVSLAPPSPGSQAAVPGGTAGARPGAAMPNTASALQNALRGVQAMQPPPVQTVRTPAAPQLKAPPHEAQLINMLSSLGVSPQDLMRMRLGGR